MITETLSPALARERLKTHSQAQAEALDYIIKRRNGEIRSLRTPWAAWNDSHIDGIEMGQVATIAGMSSSGKSLILNQLQSDIFELNPNEQFMILNFNFEMTSQKIAMRELISKTGINMRSLLSAGGIMLGDQELLRVTQLLTNTNTVPIYYCEYPKTVAQYKMIVRKFYETHQLPFIVTTDHSVLFKKDPNDNEAKNMLYNLADASIELKKDVPVTQIHISQLNREIEDKDRVKPGHQGNIPMKGDIFGGDALYQCADTVLINHRPFILNFPVNQYTTLKLPTGPNDVYWHFLKIRDGSPHREDMIGDFRNFKILDKITGMSAAA